MANYRKRTPAQFPDVRQILDSAIQAGGARYKLATPGAAIHWRQRAYTYRTLLREHFAKVNEGTGILPTTPYDEVGLQIDPADPCTVIIRPVQPRGELLGLDGQPLVDVETTPSPANADLIAEAEALKKELGL